MLLAREIDARAGGRATVEEVVRRWQALPLETKVAAVGQAAATADHRARMDEDTLVAQAQAAMRPRGVKFPEGILVRPATAGRTPPGQRVLTLPENDPADGAGTEKQRTAGTTAPGEVAPDPDGAGRLIGNPPATAGASAVSGVLYWIEFVALYCHNESTWDGGSNSDEPFCSLNMFDDSNHSWAKRTAVYSDVDDREIRSAKPSPLVLWGPAPLPTERTTISALITEHDFGNPDTITQAWHDAATVAACVAKYYGVDVDQSVQDSAANLLDLVFNLGDDIIGWDSIVMWPEYLEWVVTQPLMRFKNFDYHFALFHTDNDSEYYTLYRVFQTG
jgi:hypothetical protein